MRRKIEEIDMGEINIGYIVERRDIGTKARGKTKGSLNAIFRFFK